MWWRINNHLQMIRDDLDMPEPDDCICEDPIHPGKRLWLCGSELCDRMKDAYFNFKPLKKIIISDDTPEEEPR